MYYAYDRTSSKEQHLDRGIAEINRYVQEHSIPLGKIFTDKMSGKTFDRPRYTVMKEDVLRPGDCLIITEVDRFGRSKSEILHELEYYKKNNIRVMILELPTTLINLDGLSTELSSMIMETINNLLIEMYASQAEAEMHKREKRQKEGIERKKDRGEWEDYGRKRAIPFSEFQKHYKRVQSGEINPFSLMRELGLSSTTFYRYKKELEALESVKITTP